MRVERGVSIYVCNIGRSLFSISTNLTTAFWVTESCRGLPQKENTLSGESISLAYEFGEQKWLKKVFLKNMTIRANMNDIFRCSTIKAERGTSYPFARTVSFSVNMTF